MDKFPVVVGFVKFAQVFLIDSCSHCIIFLRIVYLALLWNSVGATESSQTIPRLDLVSNIIELVPFGTTDLWGGLSSPPRLKEKPQAGKPAPQCSAVPMGLDFICSLSTWQ
jgi:hypothetical protein